MTRSRNGNPRATRGVRWRWRCAPTPRRCCRSWPGAASCPDIVTDQTFPDPLKGYVPAELSLEQARAMRKDDPKQLMAMARRSVATHLRAMLDFLDRGAIVFEYGNSLRAEARAAGVEDRVSDALLC